MLRISSTVKTSQAWKTVLRCHLTSTANIESQLSVFEEYKSAKHLLHGGNYKKATSLLERVLDIVQTAIGSSSPITAHVRRSLGANYFMQGEYDKSIRTLKSGGFSTTDIVRNKQLSSKFHLLHGDASAALGEAVDATELCEGLSSEETDISLFSGCYAAKGLSYLSLGSAADAEAFLQLAARWAQTRLEQLVALNNLGACSWYALDEELGSSAVVRHRERRLVLEHTPADGKLPPAPALPADVLSHRLLREAAAYWDEALADAQRSTGAGATGGSAAAMCGPMGGSAGEDALGMTGLGSKALQVGRVTPSEIPVATGEGEDLAARLADARYAAAYCGLLCNLAESNRLQGEADRQGDLVAAALKAVEGHTDSAAVQPVLGRVLALAAAAHADASNAVTAEGLFRSAVDKLSGPAAGHDPRYQFERALAMGAYGRLLRQWDRREAAGEAMIMDARNILAKLPQRQDTMANLFLSPLIQFPV